jgi:phospholipase/carboxylesterase
VVARLSAPSVPLVPPRAAARRVVDARAVDPLTPVARPQLSGCARPSRSRLAAARLQAPGQPMLLAGFSQGPALAIEYLCAGLPPPDAVVRR